MAKKKKSKLWLWILLIFVALMAVLALVFGGNKPKGERVHTEKIEKRTLKETVSGSGKIFPETEVKISSDVSGEIVELYIEEGDSV